MKIKICGLFREADIAYANSARPDYIGFVFAPSKRQVSAETARRLRDMLDAGIQSVGVFVNADAAYAADLANGGVIDMIQLHGDEDDAYIARLRALCAAPVIKAVRVGETAAPPPANADYYLLDSGAGSGKTFDWARIAAPGKPFFLAGGIHIGNISAAMATKPRPFCIDVSSGAETGGVKDLDKMLALARAARGGDGHE